jgi:hypothetical protein
MPFALVSNNEPVPNLDQQIDDLYRKPLDEFIAARSALARDLKGADAQRVKQLKKPTLVPWAVNQVYWHARSMFDRAQRAGEELRRLQIAALKGRTADVRSASDAHREALTAAVDQAIRFADAAGAQPSRDQLMRTFEALSLASEPPEHPGRLTEPLQPGGFEMLTGVSLPTSLKPRGTTGSTSAGGAAKPAKPADPKQEARALRVAAAAAKARERELAQAARQKETAIKKAEADLERARAREAEASRTWERAREEVEKARQALLRARQ